MKGWNDQLLAQEWWYRLADDHICFYSVMAVADHKKKLIALASIIAKAVPVQTTDPAPLEIVAPSSSSVEIVEVCIKDM